MMIMIIMMKMDANDAVNNDEKNGLGRQDPNG